MGHDQADQLRGPWVIRSEWDIGHERLVFNTEHLAMAAAKELFDAQDWDEDTTWDGVCGDYIYAEELTRG